MSLFHKPKAPPYRVRYVGHRRPRWFKKKVPMWVVEAYTESAPPFPEMPSEYGYKIMGKFTDEDLAYDELNRFNKTHPQEI